MQFFFRQIHLPVINTHLTIVASKSTYYYISYYISLYLKYAYFWQRKRTSHRVSMIEYNSQRFLHIYFGSLPQHYSVFISLYVALKRYAYMLLLLLLLCMCMHVCVGTYLHFFLPQKTIFMRYFFILLHLTSVRFYFRNN